MDLPVDLRDEYISKACEKDKSLYEEVKSLLDFDNHPLLDRSALEALSLNTLATNTNNAAPLEINQYKVLEKLGEGGMGDVYAAQQKSPAERKVAIKLLKPMGNQSQLVEECHALAQLNHPNIATLYEVGEWKDGLVFIAMELVEGCDIVSWCESHNYSEQSIIKLFQQLCSSITHAHERGIIHCDIKPSNILITDANGEATVKVIDFGISLFEDKTTDHYNYAGTPSYLSPESFNTSQRNVDTRRDVYALGVVLHKLLTNRLPDKTLTDEGFGTLKTDLKFIIRKAIDDERDQRYSSAKELNDELTRYLNYEIIEARPKEVAYKTVRFIQRNLAFVLFSLALFSSLIIGYFTQAHQAKLAQKEANIAQIAQQEAEELSNFMIQLFEISNPDKAQKDKTTVIQMIETAKQKLLAIAAPKAVDAKFMFTLGSIFTRLDQLEDAQLLLEKAVEVKKNTLKNNHPEIIAGLMQLGVVYRRQNKNQQSELVLIEALRLQKSLPPDPVNEAYIHNHLGNLYWQISEPETAIIHHQNAVTLRQQAGDKVLLADSLNNLAVIYQVQKKWKEALELFKKAHQIYLIHYGPIHPYIGSVLNNMAWCEENLFNFSATEKIHKESYQVTEQSYGPNHSQAIRSQSNLARFYNRRMQFSKAIDLWQIVIKKQETLNKFAQASDSYSKLARVYQGSNQFLKAEALNLKSLKLIESFPSNDFRLKPRLKSRYAITLMNLNRYKEAIDLVNQALIELNQFVKEDDFMNIYLRNQLAEIYMQMGDVDQALTVLGKALSLKNSSHYNQQQLIKTHLWLGRVYKKQLKIKVASEELQMALELSQSIYGDKHKDQGEIMFELGALQILENEAIGLDTLNKAKELQQLTLPESHPDLALTTTFLTNFSSQIK